MIYNDSKNVVLVLGAQGNLGSQIVQELKESEKGEIIAWTRNDCDVMDIVSTEKSIRKIKPSIVINTVAYNDVDACETNLDEQRKAIILNVQLVDCLARVCKEINSKLVHFSSNYVFSGDKDSYTEFDTISPINFYGMTKQLGEEAILSRINEGLCGSIIRVSNLFGPRGASQSSKPSFFDTIADAAKVRNSLNIVNDEKCCFTYTKDVAHMVTKMLGEENFQGIYHCVNSNPVTWYEAAQKYFNLINISIHLQPVESRSFNRVAKRPKSAVLQSTRTLQMRSYELALAEYVQKFSKPNDN